MVELTRPSWTDYLLGLARVVSRRSHDSQTQHGCILVGSDHRILSTGCNGFPRNLRDDRLIPNTRPEKYPWMLHAEENALANANGPVEGATAYVTGTSCFHCLILLWQSGVKTVVQDLRRGWQMDEVERGRREFFLEQSGMEVRTVKSDLCWLRDFAESLEV